MTKSLIFLWQMHEIDRKPHKISFSSWIVYKWHILEILELDLSTSNGFSNLLQTRCSGPVEEQIYKLGNIFQLSLGRKKTELEGWAKKH